MGLGHEVSLYPVMTPSKPRPDRNAVQGAGIVRAVGPMAKQLKVGDRVGWGYVHDTCGICQHCLKGTETYCSERRMYGTTELDQGSFARQAVWREAFLFKTPDHMSDEVAAPLQCGGATVFNALHMFDVQPTSRVGIIGVGGLGHLGIQFANKMGCEVVVFSGSDSKKEEAQKLGAHEFYATKGVKELNVRKPIDVLMVTTSAQPDWNQFVPVMANGGMIIPLSVADGDFKFPYMTLIEKGLRVQGSIVASRYIHQRMLSFAALHDIKPMINIFPMSKEGIEKAMKALEDGQVRYRAVLVPDEIA